MTRRLAAMLVTRLDEARFDEVPDGRDPRGVRWDLAIRAHWGVETTHQILDVALREDEHPWIESEPRAALVVAVIRRIVYTMLALFRSVTQRSDEKRAVPWRSLLDDTRDAPDSHEPAHEAGPVRATRRRGDGRDRAPGAAGTRPDRFAPPGSRRERPCPRQRRSRLPLRAKHLTGS
jgi:hypothetical protein